MERQDSFVMREFEDAEVDYGEDGGDVIVDVGNNADLCAANQENTDLINEAYMDEVPIRFMIRRCKDNDLAIESQIVPRTYRA